MDTYNITDHTQLQYRIMHLKAKRAEQEEEIIRNVKEIYYSLQPVALLKKAFKELGGNSELRHDLTSVGLNTAADFIIGKIFGRSGSVKGFLSSLLLGKISGYVVDKYSDSITSGIGKVKDYIVDYFQTHSHKNGANN